MNQEFVTRWIDDWNQKNLESILSHYSDTTQFTSPKALQIAGTTTLRGKQALRVYWTTALQRINDLHFVLDHWMWDAGKRELVVIYNSRLNGVVTRACEIIRFGTDGLAYDGEAMYGAPIE